VIARIQLFVAALILAACSSTPQSAADLPEALRQSSVVAVQDPTVRLPASGTFAWLPGSRLQRDRRVDTDFLDHAVRETLRDTLAARGFTASESSPTAFWVGYVGALESAMDDATVNTVFGIDAGWRPASASDTSQTYEKGTLIVVIVELHTKRVAFRGAVQANVSFDLPENVRQERVQRAIGQLLARFQ
jgi:hypothetical protein